MTISISAIICTYNRESYLHKAIQSLVEQTLETYQYEIIVVDNCSTDNTKQVVTEQFSCITNLRYLYEPIQGLSQARNTGWQNAKGEYVAYLDDDAIASPKWLEKILKAFEAIEPKTGAVGGRVEAIWEAPRPSWLSDNLLPFLTVIDWSKEPTILTHNKYLPGANMAFPKFLLSNLGGFSVKLGRKGNSLLSNEEIVFNQKLQQLGHICYYDPEILVQHHIPAKRTTQDYFRRRKYWQGVSNAVLQSEEQSLSRFRRWQRSIQLLIDILKNHERVYSLIRKRNTSGLFEKELVYQEKIGRLAGYLFY